MMPVAGQHIAKRLDSFAESEIGEEIVLMNLQNGSFFSLSGTGLRIWRLIDEYSNGDDLITRMCDEFEIGQDVCRVEVNSFLDSLCRAGFVSLGAAPS